MNSPHSCQTVTRERRWSGRRRRRSASDLDNIAVAEEVAESEVVEEEAARAAGVAWVPSRRRRRFYLAAAGAGAPSGTARRAPSATPLLTFVATCVMDRNPGLAAGAPPVPEEELLVRPGQVEAAGF